MVWITNIFKDDYNCMIFDTVKEGLQLDTSINTKGNVKCQLMQDKEEQDWNVRLI